LPSVTVAFDESHTPLQRVSVEYSAFFSYLEKFGYITTTIPDATTITPELLATFDVLVIPCSQASYTNEELNALEDWVNNGGRLLLISDYGPFNYVSNIAMRFNVVLAQDKLRDTDNHIVEDFWIYFNGSNVSWELKNEGIKYVEVYASDGIISAPSDEIKLIITDTDGTTIWNNGTLASGVSVMSAFDRGSIGFGRMIIICDSNIWDSSRDTDGDGINNFYDGDNYLLAIKSIKWLSEPYFKPRPRILAYVEYTDYLQEYANSINAITETFGPIYPILTELWNYTLLHAMLPEKEILLIPEQEKADFSRLNQIGVYWRNIIQNYVRNGGILILCDYSWGIEGTYVILTNAQLMEIIRSNSVTGKTVSLKDPFDPLAKDVSDTFIAPDGASNYVTREENVIFESETYPVVLHKTIGYGHIVLIGFDYYSVNLNTAKILGNAVNLAFQLKIRLSPNRGSYGTIVTVTGRDASKNSIIQIFWDEKLLDTVIADDEGNFTYFLMVPQTTLGIHHIKTVDTSSHETDTEIFNLLESLDVQIEVGTTYQCGENSEFYIQTRWMYNPIDANVTITLYKPQGIEALASQRVEIGLQKAAYTIPKDALEGIYLIVVKATYKTEDTSLTGTAVKSFRVELTVQNLENEIKNLQDQTANLENENRDLKDRINNLKSQNDSLIALLYVVIFFTVAATTTAIISIRLIIQKSKPSSSPSQEPEQTVQSEHPPPP
jgi:hypothetical protein